MYKIFAVTIRKIIPLTERTFKSRMLTSLTKSNTVSSFFLGRGIGLVCTRRFSFHEFYNFLLFNFLIFIFLEDIFLPTTFTHTHDPRPTTHTHDPPPLPTTHDPRHLATLQIYRRNFPPVGLIQSRKVLLRYAVNHTRSRHMKCDLNRFDDIPISFYCLYLNTKL